MTILPTSENELTSANNNNTNTIISTNNNNSRPSSSISILTTAGNAFDSKKSQPYPPSSSVLMSDIVDGIKIPETETNDLNNDSLRFLTFLFAVLPLCSLLHLYCRKIYSIKWLTFCYWSHRRMAIIILVKHACTFPRCTYKAQCYSQKEIKCF